MSNQRKKQQQKMNDLIAWMIVGPAIWVMIWAFLFTMGGGSGNSAKHASSDDALRSYYAYHSAADQKDME